MTLREEALHMHRKNKGKLESKSKVAVRNAKDLSLAYSPGVAEPCKDIYENPEKVYEYTMKGNMVAVVSDGTAVLRSRKYRPGSCTSCNGGKSSII